MAHVSAGCTRSVAPASASSEDFRLLPSMVEGEGDPVCAAITWQEKQQKKGRGTKLFLTINSCEQEQELTHYPEKSFMRNLPLGPRNLPLGSTSNMGIKFQQAIWATNTQTIVHNEYIRQSYKLVPNSQQFNTIKIYFILLLDVYCYSPHIFTQGSG